MSSFPYFLDYITMDTKRSVFSFQRGNIAVSLLEQTIFVVKFFCPTSTDKNKNGIYMNAWDQK